MITCQTAMAAATALKRDASNSIDAQGPVPNPSGYRGPDGAPHPHYPGRGARANDEGSYCERRPVLLQGRPCLCGRGAHTACCGSVAGRELAAVAASAPVRVAAALGQGHRGSRILACSVTFAWCMQGVWVS